jgi:hypothetical protein
LRLEALALAGNDLGADGVEALLNSLCTWGCLKGLRSLDLSCNTLGDGGAKVGHEMVVACFTYHIY